MVPATQEKVERDLEIEAWVSEWRNSPRHPQNSLFPRSYLDLTNNYLVLAGLQPTLSFSR